MFVRRYTLFSCKIDRLRNEIPFLLCVSTLFEILPNPCFTNIWLCFHYSSHKKKLALLSAVTNLHTSLQAHRNYLFHFHRQAHTHTHTRAQQEKYLCIVICVGTEKKTQNTHTVRVWKAESDEKNHLIFPTFCVCAIYRPSCKILCFPKMFSVRKIYWKVSLGPRPCVISSRKHTQLARALFANHF